jgi:hypothetical protein
MAQPRSMAVAAVNFAPSTVESKKTHPELGVRGIMRYVKFRSSNRHKVKDI